MSSSCICTNVLFIIIIMKFTPRLDEAIRISARAHRNQKRRGSDTPYIVHPYGVMVVASQYTNDEDVLIACLLHDIIEDVPDEYTTEQMKQQFGDNVLDLVLGVTKDRNITDWKASCDDYLYRLENKAPAESTIIAVADKIHNIMSMLHDYETAGDKIWNMFAADKLSQKWWFEATREVAQKRIPDNKILKAYDEYLSKLITIIDD